MFLDWWNSNLMCGSRLSPNLRDRILPCISCTPEKMRWLNLFRWNRLLADHINWNKLLLTWDYKKQIVAMNSFRIWTKGENDGTHWIELPESYIRESLFRLKLYCSFWISWGRSFRICILWKFYGIGHNYEICNS